MPSGCSQVSLPEKAHKSRHVPDTVLTYASSAASPMVVQCTSMIFDFIAYVILILVGHIMHHDWGAVLDSWNSPWVDAGSRSVAMAARDGFDHGAQGFCASSTPQAVTIRGMRITVQWNLLDSNAALACRGYAQEHAGPRAVCAWCSTNAWQ